MNDILSTKTLSFAINKEFESLYNQARRARIWSMLTRRSNCLFNLCDVQQRLRSQRHGGTQAVPIRQIRGSEGRCDLFDKDFRPLKTHSRHRWLSVAKARMEDIPLPAVELIQVNDVYFVRDGHHRISVARAYGQLEIDANVTVWECMEEPVVSVSPQQRMPDAAMYPTRRQLGRAFATAFASLIIAAVKEQERS